MKPTAVTSCTCTHGMVAHHLTTVSYATRMQHRLRAELFWLGAGQQVDDAIQSL